MNYVFATPLSGEPGMVVLDLRTVPGDIQLDIVAAAIQVVAYYGGGWFEDGKLDADTRKVMDDLEKAVDRMGEYYVQLDAQALNVLADLHAKTAKNTADSGT